jgi:metallophosphoesterase (TIGR03767 family)
MTTTTVCGATLALTAASAHGHSASPGVALPGDSHSHPHPASEPLGRAAQVPNNPAGRTTEQMTIRRRAGDGYQPLEGRAGERRRVRTALGQPQRGRASRRRSMTYLGQITDPHIFDEMSPARAEFLDPVGPPFTSAWRPQEAFSPWALDRQVRQINQNRRSRLRGQGGRRATMDLAMATGDLIDNQQRNETRWYVDILDGGNVDPFSGVPVTQENCPQATPQQRQQMNDDVANRRYTGVQDYSDYPPGVPEQRQAGFWDPDRPAPAGSPYADFPRYPGLMDRAQQVFRAQGLRVPWYTSRGNHDGLIQGNIPANNPLFAAIVTSCLKVFPTAAVDPADYVGQSFDQIIGEVLSPDNIGVLLAGARLVPPDPDRRFVGKQEFKELHGGGRANRGFGFVDRRELRRSNGQASYYAWTPKRGVRFIVLDTVAVGGGSSGRVDHPQYQWLQRELDRNSSREWRNGRLVRDNDPDRIIMVFGHHSLGTMTNTLPDETAVCTGPDDPGCDRDPRSSTPIHNGLTGRQNIRDLFLRYPNVISFTNGHTHTNELQPFRRGNGRSGFWQVNTASNVDWPQQTRLLELMNNRDGTLSLFTTNIDHASPIRPPAPGTQGQQFSDAQIGSVSRELAANDPQLSARYAGEGPRHRNTELVIRDPRQRGVRRARPPAFTGSLR